jgi:hypothetical protein
MLKKNIPIAFKDDIVFEIVDTKKGVSQFKIGTKIEGRTGRDIRHVFALIAPVEPKK